MDLNLIFPHYLRRSVEPLLEGGRGMWKIKFRVQRSPAHQAHARSVTESCQHD